MAEGTILHLTERLRELEAIRAALHRGEPAAVVERWIAEAHARLAEAAPGSPCEVVQLLDYAGHAAQHAAPWLAREAQAAARRVEREGLSDDVVALSRLLQLGAVLAPGPDHLASRLVATVAAVAGTLPDRAAPLLAVPDVEAVQAATEAARRVPCLSVSEFATAIGYTDRSVERLLREGFLAPAGRAETGQSRFCEAQVAAVRRWRKGSYAKTPIGPDGAPAPEQRVMRGPSASAWARRTLLKRSMLR
ncbi:hypothetical protein [Methylorubrum populi]|uniref:Uncharacterized protein n=1 Tax=Methylorubrum populi TaxID=223967 RepID=A0A833J4Y0_9HYPH|nr:hypothetical protein [Methylorubrum populi]KAB7783666.1 hypothetical protein F8B43_3589 [Methylorubrum populi]